MQRHKRYSREDKIGLVLGTILGKTLRIGIFLFLVYVVFRIAKHVFMH